ncbi:MAG: hypothetical protein WHS89_01665 [Acidimicrobiales bacterium]|jgi:hypothetical protein
MAERSTLPRVFVLVDPSTGQLSLMEADDFDRFHVTVPSGASFPEIVDLFEREQVGRAVEGSSDHIWVSIEVVRRLAGARGDGWSSGFEGMLAYARSKGWTDETDTHVRAHLIWSA